MGHLLYVKLLFWRPWGSILGTRDTILVILGSRGTPNGHTEAQMSIFIDFRLDLGSLLGLTLAPFCCFSVILDTKMGDKVQVHVFGDPGMEMMPECTGCMCLNHCKTVLFFLWFHFFHLVTNLMSGGWGLGVILESVGLLGDTFSDFVGSWKQLRIFMYFGIPLGSPKAEGTQKLSQKAWSWAQNTD